MGIEDMNKGVIIFGVVLMLFGCSMPRPYDGVLGYKIQPLPLGIQVTSIEEASLGQERMLKRLVNVCAKQLHIDPTQIKLNIDAEKLYKIDVPMDLFLPTASLKGAGKGDESSAMRGDTFSHQHDRIIRQMPVHEIVATCANNNHYSN